MNDKYRLIGKLAVACNDLIQWARWMETASRRVRVDEVGPLGISTVFLGLDHNLTGRGDPLLFETMVFCDGEPVYMRRCSTWGQAEAMHRDTIEWAKDRVAALTTELEPTPPKPI